MVISRPILRSVPKPKVSFLSFKNLWTCLCSQSFWYPSSFLPTYIIFSVPPPRQGGGFEPRNVAVGNTWSSYTTEQKFAFTPKLFERLCLAALPVSEPLLEPTTPLETDKSDPTSAQHALKPLSDDERKLLPFFKSAVNLKSVSRDMQNGRLTRHSGRSKARTQQKMMKNEVNNIAQLVKVLHSSTNSSTASNMLQLLTQLVSSSHFFSLAFLTNNTNFNIISLLVLSTQTSKVVVRCTKMSSALRSGGLTVLGTTFIFLSALHTKQHIPNPPIKIKRRPNQQHARPISGTSYLPSSMVSYVRHFPT